MKIFPQNTIEMQSKLNLKKRNRNIKSEMYCMKNYNVTLSQQMKGKEIFKQILI
jgi:hypothetical protein